MKLLMTLVVLLGMVAGCKKDEKPAETAPATPPGAPAAEEKKAEAPAPAPAPAPAAIVASCDHGGSTCTDYVDAAASKEGCRPNMDGTLSDKPCPTEGLSGSCALPEKGSIRRYYSTGDSPKDATAAGDHCKNAMGGTFTAAAAK
jgi:hypothetical protein